MTTTRDLPCRMRTPSDVVRPMLPILIQVPALTSSTRGPGRPRTRRRRLRKEVRFAGLTMMSILPVGLLLVTLGGARPADRPIAPIAALTPHSEARYAAPRVSLTFEPANPVLVPKAFVPVEFPGYLLPVDGPEEPAHAGN
jgi:hypothetical protein